MSSSGNPNNGEAIPKLEKGFDDIHANQEKEPVAPPETPEPPKEEQPPAAPIPPPVTEAPKEVAPVVQKTPEPVVTPTETKTASGFLDKLKNIKLKKPSFGGGIKTPKVSALGKGGFKSKLDNFFKSKLC